PPRPRTRRGPGGTSGRRTPGRGRRRRGRARGRSSRLAPEEPERGPGRLERRAVGDGGREAPDARRTVVEDPVGEPVARRRAAGVVELLARVPVRPAVRDLEELVVRHTLRRCRARTEPGFRPHRPRARRYASTASRSIFALSRWTATT